MSTPDGPISYLSRLRDSGIVNGTTLAVIDRLLSFPESSYGPAEYALLCGTRETIGKKRWDRMTNSILSKWSRGFIRFLNGNIRVFGVDNLAYVSPKDTLCDHWEDPSWRVDWDCQLDEFEAQLVMNPHWRKGLVFSTKPK